MLNLGVEGCHIRSATLKKLTNNQFRLRNSSPHGVPPHKYKYQKANTTWLAAKKLLQGKPECYRNRVQSSPFC